MNQRDLSIEYIDIAQLTPCEKNCKIHTPEQIKHIAASIEAFGFNDPLGIWGSNNIILEGNGRVEALRLLGRKEVPCIRLDHLSDEARRAYALAHNHLNLETRFDEKELLQQLQELQHNFDFTSMGMEAEQYVCARNSLEKKELRPYRQVHYLIRLNVDDHDIIMDCLDNIRKIEGVEIDSTLN